MFDFSKFSDMSKIASEAKEIQKKQGEYQKRQIELLEKVSFQLEEVIRLLRKNTQP